MKFAIILLMLGIVLLAGCVALTDNLPLSTKTGEAGLPAETPTTPHSPKDQTLEGIVVIFHQSGGFDGINQEWAIYADGRVVPKDGQNWQATPEQVAQLLKEIEDLGYFNLNRTSLPRDTCCDRFIYELTVTYGVKTQSLTTIDGDENAPQALWDAIQKVRAFLNKE